MPQSLFLLSTVPQAFFLGYSPHLVKNATLIITVRTQTEAEKIRDEVGHLPWADINTWYLPHNNGLSAYLKIVSIRWKIIKLKTKKSHYDKIYIGSYVNLIHLSVLGEYEDRSKLFLLYDGLQMVVNNFDRKQKEVESVMQFPHFFGLLRFKRPRILSLTFVTPLPLNVGPMDSIQYISSSISLDSKIAKKNVIHFLGQPLPAFDIVSTNFYLESLEKIKKLYRGSKIIYFPHPREEESILQDIAIIFEVRKQNRVYEDYYMNLEEVPGKIISFYSSVLVNLFYFNSKSELISIYIPQKEIYNHKNKEHLAKIYNYFENISKEDFTLLKLSGS
ncbi:hypothetical protein JRG66_01070 [Salinimicrobium tongyeongense]|uniref:Uncharacterized protein n=1 Tax=Salinimicrobium tongyeongense TaxID=2809707 RepID=A0ABY6NRI7_9FLAO|nr:alpha-2,8-polysialyltransferase family protein [Salinimicrobium tongyeongense]UZH55519.1 hypothetical protein JRG66_01070 [Salinimicrobium tongyeongense]